MWETFVGQAKIVYIYFFFFFVAFDTVFENVPEFFFSFFLCLLWYLLDAFLSCLLFNGLASEHRWLTVTIGLGFIRGLI